MSGPGDDPTLGDELASIRALGEGRRGEAAEPDEVELSSEQTEDIEAELRSAGED
ncbi:hypothetical protein [Rathayibacter tanaceti]|uniref:Uncharacterized protein n=2 Tax=Rathayibacter tanaceti TaxID=1671680 RepID=A0ACD2XH35_9MICO|nr:hypothetical protein [Rathayibacter tanaceti]QHC56365.1 hypothetical protein GSU10_12455 [Rathayibacter tanaceti]TCO34890.1 hypothetical protein EV639_11044 [Rathayibacter tanaceti]